MRMGLLGSCCQPLRARLAGRWVRADRLPRTMGLHCLALSTAARGRRSHSGRRRPLWMRGCVLLPRAPFSPVSRGAYTLQRGYIAPRGGPSTSMTTCAMAHAASRTLSLSLSLCDRGDASSTPTTPERRTF